MHYILGRGYHGKLNGFRFSIQSNASWDRYPRLAVLMTQLNLFEWGEKHSLLTDLGGRCSYCLEYDNWLMTDHWDDEDYRYYTVQCQTVRTDEETGEFAEFCHNTEEIVEERES